MTQPVIDVFFKTATELINLGTASKKAWEVYMTFKEGKKYVPVSIVLKFWGVISSAKVLSYNGKNNTLEVTYDPKGKRKGPRIPSVVIDTKHT